jgi:predicted N-formylglutamate amidohydrolase
MDDMRPHAEESPVVVIRAEARCDVVLVCEHAAHRLPRALGAQGLGPDAQRAHIAWDPGALGLARGLSQRLRATLVAATLSRLAYDLNRPPDSPQAMATRSEVFAVPGNEGLTERERVARTEAVYLPFHTTLHGVIARRLAAGRRPVLVTVHSFTPVWFGTSRDTELGVIHDADDRLARIVAAEAAAQTGLRVALNDPYSAADGVTHTLRLHATPYRLPHVMLELRNDLIATPDAQADMARRLAPVLIASLDRLATDGAAA